jgi:hypothetical protein
MLTPSVGVCLFVSSSSKFEIAEVMLAIKSDDDLDGAKPKATKIKMPQSEVEKLLGSLPAFAFPPIHTPTEPPNMGPKFQLHGSLGAAGIGAPTWNTCLLHLILRCSRLVAQCASDRLHGHAAW